MSIAADKTRWSEFDVLVIALIVIVIIIIIADYDGAYTKDLWT